MSLFNNFERMDSILSKRRSGTSADPYVNITESLPIVNNKVILTEIPDKLTKVSVSGNSTTWTEIETGEPTTNQYKVDYFQGVVTFNPEKNNLTLSFTYKGTGGHYFPASRVYSQNSNTDVVENLQDLINAAETIKNEAILANQEMLETAQSIQKYTYGSDFLPWDKIREQFKFRTLNNVVIETFENPTDWTGVADTIEGKPARSATSNSSAIVEKSFTSALALGNFILFEFEIDNVYNLNYLTFYIATNNTFASYYSLNLGLLLKSEKNIVAVNKRDFSTTGSPSWTNLKHIRFKAIPASGKSIQIKVGKIETYNMNPMCTLFFDDGYDNQYTEAFIRMQAKNMPGAIAIYADGMNTAGHLTVAQLKEMYNAGWDVTNHSKTHRNLSTLPRDEQEYEIIKGMEYLQSIGIGRSSLILIPPYGGTNNDTIELSQQYCIANRWKYGLYNPIPVPDRHRLAVQNVQNTTTVATIQGWIDTAIANDLWLILLFHAITPTASTSAEYSTTNLQAVIDYLDSKKNDINVVNVTDAFYRC